jgi:hypothetical protein
MALMIELMRTFLGYCVNCRRPSVVGEFKLFGWQHGFNLCQTCIEGLAQKLQNAEVPK